MGNLKLLRVQVAAKVAYLESEQAVIDAVSGWMNHYDKSMMLRTLDDRAAAFKEVLADIDTLEAL